MRLSILPIPYSYTTGTYYVYIKADANGDISETNENNNRLKLSGNIQITQNWQLSRQNLPYPILFVHGWVGDGTSWYDFTEDLNFLYGWTDGGVLDYCLNYDNNLSTGKLSTDFHDYTNPIMYKV
ncbi:MAG: hypothetical protein LC122_04730, partial [Chitinophagales bacterium]|nr:hypothetical protein [Chitinophagales bacterium]